MEDYRIPHRPTPDGPPIYDLLQGDRIPSDVYTHPQYYTGFIEFRQAINAIKRVRGNPEGNVIIYRASPRAELNPGDWVTLSRKYAKQHGMADDPKNDVPVHKFTVKAKDLIWSMDDLMEFGY